MDKPTLKEAFKMLAGGLAIWTALSSAEAIGVAKTSEKEGLKIILGCVDLDIADCMGTPGVVLYRTFNPS